MRTPTNIRMNLVYHQKLESMLKIVAADSMGLPLSVFTQLFSESMQKILSTPQYL